MSVYIDYTHYRYGNMILCHMLADHPRELLDMARRIKLDVAWLRISRKGIPHFDICKAKRKLAVQQGALPLYERRELCQLIKRLRARLKQVQGP